MVSRRGLEVVVVGDGIAGYTAAAEIRRLKPQANITLIGAEKLPPYSACALPDYLAGYQPREGVFISSLASMEGIKVIKGQVVEAIDTARQEVHAGGKRLTYDRLILATGSIAPVPSVPGAELHGNFTLKTLGDADAIRAWGGSKAVVVGSGAVGVETSLALRERGLEVTLVELLDHILPAAFDAEASCLLQAELEKHGIRVLVGEKVLAVEGRNRVSGVSTTCGRIGCELVIWAVGAQPRVALAREAKIDIGELRGIKVDHHMATSVPNVYACGDCVQTWDPLLKRPTLSLLWATAKEQAVVAASNCVGEERLYLGSLGVLVEEVGNVTAVAVGFTEAGLKDVSDIEVSTAQDASGYWKLITKDDQVLGLQFVGNLQGVGAVMAWMKRGTGLTAARKVLESPVYLKGAPWYYQGARFVARTSARSCSLV